MSTMEFKAFSFLMSYVALKANEVVLDGHWEVLLLLVILFSHFHTQFAEPRWWRSSLRRIPVGNLSVKLLVPLLAQAQSWNSFSPM